MLQLAVSLASVALSTAIMWHTFNPSIIGAQRWRHIDRLREHWGNVDILRDGASYPYAARIDCGAGLNKRSYKAATVDIALAQALNDLPPA